MTNRLRQHLMAHGVARPPFAHDASEVVAALATDANDGLIAD